MDDLCDKIDTPKKRRSPPPSPLRSILVSKTSQQFDKSSIPALPEPPPTTTRTTSSSSSTDALNTSKKLLKHRNLQLKVMSDDSLDETATDDDTSVDSLLIRRRRFEESVTSPQDMEHMIFETDVIIEFRNNINMKTLHWIIDKIRGKKSEGGAELLIRREPHEIDSNEGLILHISAKNIKFLQLADEMELMKLTKSGVMKNFNVSCLDDFFVDGNIDVDNVLTSADRQLIIKYALDNIKANVNEKTIYGMDDISLYHGESILLACLEHGIIENIYSLHDTEFIKKLGADWYLKWFKRQPIDRVREYFGESIGIYFSFVEYYTFAIIVPAFLGILQYFLSGGYVPFFCIFYVIWLTIFMEVWKRKCAVLAYRWGTITMTNLDTPRIGFYGKIGRDPVTGKLQPQYPIWKTYAFMYFISLPIILICMLPAAGLAMSQFWLEDQIKMYFDPDSIVNYVPSILEALCVALFSGKFESFANWLTDRENHRTQAQYERHRVVKLIALEFVNNFLSLFYIAFWLGDITMLRSQLLTQLIVFQIVQKLQGSLLPLVMPKLIVLKDSVLHSWYHSQQNTFNSLNIDEIAGDDPRILQNKRESTLLEYNSTYEDYLEMYIQFGYVALFASVTPLAALAALINNLIEIRLDAYKLCCIYRRPFAKRAKNTGAWLLAFETLLVMSIITNCGLLYLQPEIRDLAPNSSPQEVLFVFVIVEHLLLAVAWAINTAIPDRPWWVRIALAKADYESRQAVKRESAQLTRNILFRRFYSVHGSHNRNILS